MLLSIVFTSCPGRDAADAGRQVSESSVDARPARYFHGIGIVHGVVVVALPASETMA
jgi:hypothetical protein